MGGAHCKLIGVNSTVVIEELMNNWKKYTFAFVIVTVAGLAYINNSNRNTPSDLRDAVADNTKSQDFDTAITDAKTKTDINFPEAKAASATQGILTLRNTINCTTVGDALSEVNVKKNTIEIIDMADKADVYDYGGFVDLSNGRALAATGQKKDSVIFGGAVDKAILMVLSKNNSGTISGQLAEGGRVYFLNCKGAFPK